MIRIKNLTVRNFMSVGNATQAITFDRSDLTLVLGENLDLGGNGSKNGCGKTTLLNALSYAFYGQSLSDIRVGNLINKTNEKNMLTSVEFDVDDIEYRIERGRKPNILRFFKNNIDLNADEDDNARGENKETQKEIEQLLKLSHDMFKHTVGLNTYTTPFLSLKVGDQRNIIEQLLGITVLSEKADKLKEVLKDTKDDIKEEEYRLGAILKANQHIEEQIDNLKRRQRVWKVSKDKTTSDLADAIEGLMDLDVEDEIHLHSANDAAIIQADKDNTTAKHDADVINAESKRVRDAENAELRTYTASVNDCSKWIRTKESDSATITRSIAGLQKDIELIDEHKCHSCGQDLHDDMQEENKKNKTATLEDFASRLLANEQEIDEHKLKLADLGLPPVVAGTQPRPIVPDIVEPKVEKTFYRTVKEAHEHKSTLETLTAQLGTAIADTDPYAEQIDDMKDNGIQPITYDDMNVLVVLQDHQQFLLNLLTKKDSFIRRKIIEQNLAYLNNRLTHYLQEIGLPHVVHFQSDLTVEISEMGRELDFDNLSRGERTRLILSLSWAFRDVWESLYSHINLLFVDELVDNGLDAAGLDSAVKILKGFARERGKSVWLVSHKDELISRVNNTMMVVKTGGFTEYNEVNE